MINLNGINVDFALKSGIVLSPSDIEEQLDLRLLQGIKQNKITGEQWFRKPDIWYSMTSYSNPYFTVHSELQLIKQSYKEIVRFLSKKTLAFYGVGTGDTESEIVKILLDNEGYVEIVGIDAIKEFLERYCSCLINLLDSHKKQNIRYIGLNKLFESLKRSDIEPENSEYKQKAHICLGTTIGNFEPDQIFSIFKKMSNLGDILILGFHLDGNLEKIKNRYENAYKFKELISNFMPDPHLEKIKILTNEKERRIEAWYDNLMIFHSKKFNQKELNEIARRFGFKQCFECDDKNSCIMVFEYDTSS